MQSVADAFSVEEVDATRRIAQSVQVAWKKDFRAGIRTFTIGVSAIGGSDIIGGPAGVQSAWNRYLYEDESAYVTSISYERQLNMPGGGISKALAEVDLMNVGEPDYGYSLDVSASSSNYASVPYTFPTDAYTIVFAYKATASLGFNEGIMEQAGSFLLFRQGGGDVEVYAYLNAPNDFAGLRRLRFRNFTTTTADGAWHTRAYVVYVSSGSAKCDEYEDGVKLGATHTVDYTGDTATPSGNLRLGNTSTTGTQFNGKLDHVKIFNAQLTAADVATVTAGGSVASTPPGAFWGFDEGSGSVIRDSSGNGNTGTRNGTASYSTDTNGMRIATRAGRFIPRYMGGDSGIFTAVDKPRRPMIINAGFKIAGSDSLLPQFIGVTTRTPDIDLRNKTVRLVGADMIDFLQNKIIEDTTIFTGQRSDQIIAAGLAQLGYSTAQYQLGQGINIIPFAMIEQGGRWGDVMNNLVQAEFGHLYQDEEGRIIFQNRQAWTQFPYFNVQRVITTAQVLSARIPDDDQIINVVEVKASPRVKQPTNLIWRLSSAVPLNTTGDTEVWANFDDPVVNLDTPVFAATTNSDGTGTAVGISLKSATKFTTSAKFVFTSGGAGGYITQLDVSGRVARVVRDIYVRTQDDSSVTAYEERPYQIENNFIQDETWAKSLGQLIVNDYSEKSNLMEITIRAIPELQLGDLISWMGHYWRVFGIKTMIDPGSGFTQELKLVQRSTQTYFRIGISTIGSTDLIAP